MQKMTPDQMAKWSRTREAGLGRFILVQGVIRWGVLTAVLFTVFSWLFTEGFRPAFSIPVNFVLFPLGGIFWGWTVWVVTEKQFKAAQASQGV